MTRWRLAVVGVPLTVAGLLAVQVRYAATGEYLPADPGYVVEATAQPAASAGRDGPPLRLVMLGDSTVAGVGSPTVEDSLPVQVARRLADRAGRSVHAVGLGVSGARTADIRDRQLPTIADRRADAVVIVVGSNDVTHVTPPWRFDDDTRGMLRAARRHAGDAIVVLAGIPLFGGADALARPLRDVVDLYARSLRRIQATVAADEGVTFVNIARDASPRFAGVADAMSADGFHPAPAGYGFWADAIVAALEPLSSRCVGSVTTSASSPTHHPGAAEGVSAR